MSVRRCAQAIVLAVCTSFPSLAMPRVMEAQRLFGNVVLSDGRTPAAGAIITVLDSAGRTVARDLASAHGDYVIPLGRAGTFSLMTQRVGSVPDTVRHIAAAMAQDVRVGIVLAHMVARPNPVAQRSRPVCGLAADTTGLASLWGQFQVALASHEIAVESQRFIADWTVTERVLAANLRDTIGRSESVERLALDLPVLASVASDSSERLGFVIESPDGVVYFAPTLATFRSAVFPVRRCFAFEPAPASQPGWIGLHFWTASYRIGVSEIEGTVWFDAASLEPRALTYLYGGLPPAFAAARSGGGLRFLRLPTGHWITDEWTIRVPSGRYQRMFAYDVRGNPMGYGNLRLDGVRIRVARLAELRVSGTTILRNPE